MRILFLTNLFPPLSNGGYEMWCEEIAHGLHQAGHSVRVITTRPFRPLLEEDPSWVFRDLHMEMKMGSPVHSFHFFTRRQRHEQENLNCLRSHTNEFGPDIIMIWGMWNLPRSLAALAEELLPGRVVYYMGDYWPTLPTQHFLYWQAPAQNMVNFALKAILKPIAFRILRQDVQPELRFEHVLFPSRFMQEEFKHLGVKVGNSQVVTGAVVTSSYAPAPEQANRGPGLSLLYAGRLSPEKGVETAIEALRILVQKHGIKDVCLTIVGGGESGYRQRLQEQVEKQNLGNWISFRRPVEKAKMPDLYRQFDVFLFTSTWNEPFGRVLVEALASGVVVIGTATGGAGEIIEPENTGLIFSPGDAGSLAQAILRLRADPSLRQRMAKHGLAIAQEKYDIQRMAMEIENYLMHLVPAGERSL